MSDFFNDQKIPNDDEIDLLEIMRKLWAGRISILLTTALFVVLGGLYVIYNKFTIIPEFESRVVLYVDSPTPEFLPTLLGSTPFLTEVLKISLKDSGNTQTETVSDVLNKKTKPPQGSIAGLNGRINAIPGNAGTLEVIVKMQDPFVAKQLADSISQKISAFLINFQMQRVQKNIQYLAVQYRDAETNYLVSLKKLSDFYDQHTAKIRSMDTIMLKRLRAESDLKFNVLNELAVQLEKTRIKEEERLAVCSILEPASVANQCNATKTGKIVLLMFFLGVFAGVGLIFVKGFINKFRKDKVIVY